MYVSPLAFGLIDEIGTGFTVDSDGNGKVVVTLLKEGRTTLTRVSQNISDEDAGRIFDFALSVGRAIKDDAKEGWIRTCFADDSWIDEALELDLEFDLVDEDSNDYVEATLTCWEGSLCNPVGAVRIILPRQQLWKQVTPLSKPMYGC